MPMPLHCGWCRSVHQECSVVRCSWAVRRLTRAVVRHRATSAPFHALSDADLTWPQIASQLFSRCLVGRFLRIKLLSSTFRRPLFDTSSFWSVRICFRVVPISSEQQYRPDAIRFLAPSATSERCRLRRNRMLLPLCPTAHARRAETSGQTTRWRRSQESGWTGDEEAGATAGCDVDPLPLCWVF